ncbi:MAG: adenylate/guanylate cyclase domain-containing protein [Ekhidna sp.]
MKLKELEECIDLEIVRTEKRRLEIFLGVMFFALALLIVNITIFPDSISDVFYDDRSMDLAIYLSLGFILLLFYSRYFVGKLCHLEKPLPDGYTIYSISIDSLIPFVWLYFIIKWEEKGILLDSPMIFIFFIIIIVSTLHLNFWLSFLNGAIIALAYASITLWVFNEHETTGMLPAIVYYTKAIFFLISGACAGLVAREFKKRLEVSIQTQDERDQIEELFSQQVSKQVADALRSVRDYSEKMEASVMFLDIRDFTQRVQFLSPEDVNRFQNKFFGPIIDCVNANNGLVNQIMGDGLMATFASSEKASHEEHALQAANEILAHIEKVNHSDKNNIKVGIGIHSGEIIAGNIGTKDRKQFSISGIPVITAARLEQITKEHDTSLLVSKEFYEKVSHLAKNGKAIGPVKLKGLDRQLEIIKLA